MQRFDEHNPRRGSLSRSGLTVPARHRCGGGLARPARAACTTHPPWSPAAKASGDRELRFTRILPQGFALPVPGQPRTVPDNAEMVRVILDAAQSHFDAHRYQAALQFVRLLQSPADSPAWVWQQLGELQFSLGNYEEAGMAFGNAAAHRPEDAILQVRLAVTCLRLGDIPSFESYLQHALDLDPEAAPARQLLADLNRDEGRFEDAARLYRELLARQPGSYENLMSLALCCARLGDNQTALEYLQQAGVLARNASDTRGAMAT